MGNNIKKYKPYLYGPIIDFMGMGGLAFLFLIFFYYFVPNESTATWLTISAMLAHMVNHPHFALSYLIFYKDFKKKLTNHHSPISLKIKYWISGIFVPLIMILFVANCLINKNAKNLGLGVNAMFFFVGWHYVKQGYGCLMVYCNLNHKYFSKFFKNILLLNALFCWLFSWLKTNQFIYKNQYWGLQYASFETSPHYLILSKYICFFLGIATLFTFIFHFYKWKKNFPFIGVIAYVSAIYPWTIFPSIDPVFALLIPLFHSIQYLLISTKYQLNSINSQKLEIKNENPSDLQMFFLNKYSFSLITLLTRDSPLSGRRSFPFHHTTIRIP